MADRTTPFPRRPPLSSRDPVRGQAVARGPGRAPFLAPDRIRGRNSPQDLIQGLIQGLIPDLTRGRILDQAQGVYDCNSF